MASLLEIKKKITGVKNTRKITKAMQLVAASKMQYFQKKALSSRNYIVELLDLLQINLTHKAKSIYTQKRTEGPTLFVIYTSDKGLCGSLNSKLLNALFKSNEWLNLPEDQKLLITLGKKSADFAKYNNIKVAESFTGIVEKMSAYESLEIIDKIIDFWRENKCKEIVFVSPHYKNSFTFYPVKKTFLPLSENMLKEHLGAMESLNQPTANDHRSGYMIFEPSKAEITEKLHEMIVQGLFMQAFLELKASEYSSRMIAMKNATDAADKITKNLTLTYNKARQQAITQQIAELVGASLAM